MDNAYTAQRLAVDLAAAAGRLLVELRTSGPSGRELGDLGDRDANTLLLDRLAAERPGDAVLSEESGDDLARVNADRVWIIDPVDGTREYGMGDRPDWAVHVAWWNAPAPRRAPASPPLRCRCRRSVWCWGPTATSSTPRRPDTRACPAAGCSRPGTATGHGSCCPPPARRRS